MPPYTYACMGAFTYVVLGLLIVFKTAVQQV